VVLDTNLALSALVFTHGRLAVLRQHWQAGRYIPLVSKATAAELIRVLTYPKLKLAEEEQQELLADYLPWCSTVTIPEPPPATPPCREEYDQPFLQLATAASADYLVTGDQDLLSLNGQIACPIITADAFLNTLSEN
jgi:putative PIN family toxin of toxin-antitoxin system